MPTKKQTQTNPIKYLEQIQTDRARSQFESWLASRTSTSKVLSGFIDTIAECERCV